MPFQALWRDVCASFTTWANKHCHCSPQLWLFALLGMRHQGKLIKATDPSHWKSAHKISKTISAALFFPWSPSKKSTGPGARVWEGLLSKDFFSTSLFILLALSSFPRSSTDTELWKLSWWKTQQVREGRDSSSSCILAILTLGLMFSWSHVPHLVRIWGVWPPKQSQKNRAVSSQ